jgi:hypothetical protein
MKKYRSTQSKDLSFYVKFRTDQMENFTHGFLRNIARDGFNEIGSKMKVDEVYGSGKAELSPGRGYDESVSSPFLYISNQSSMKS